MNYTPIFIFWLVLQLFNLIGLPVAFRLFKHLPDRGYAFARSLGLLLTGYVLWLAGSFGLLQNNLGGTVIAMLLVIGFGVSRLQQDRSRSLPAWLNANKSYVLIVEFIFALGFVAWAVFKSYNPGIETAGGEKWMEIAFVNASLLSPTFPPTDPWLSGFGISYYYFGYVLMAILTRLSGIQPTMAFNLFAPTLFALTLTGAFGVVANMVAAHQTNDTRKVFVTAPNVWAAGLLGSIFVAIMGHWEGVLEVLHKRGLLSPAFWRWLDLRDLKLPPVESTSWVPDRFIWWWRGSRVILDYNLAGQEQEMIDEMPFFSFLLGDVHPHVLALPFVLPAIALALNLLLKKSRSPLNPDTPFWQGIPDLVEAVGGRTEFALYAVCIGALGFLNTWDLPIYLAVFGLAYLAWRGREGIERSILGLGAFGVLAITLYLPFYIGFQSQAGGILPNLWNPTRLPQFVIFFGPFLVVGAAFLAAFTRRCAWPWRHELRWTLPLTLIGPVALLALLATAFLVFPSGQEFVTRILNDPAVQAALNGASQSDLVAEIISRRLTNPWTFLLLGGLIGWGLALLWSSMGQSKATEPGEAHPVEKFALILLLLGLALPMSVEFIFLRDLFMTRMNTVFKFYFQAWVLLALASAFGVSYISRRLNGVWLGLWQVTVTVLVLGAMVYPALALPNKAGNFAAEPTFDGANWVAAFHPDDYAAIEWIRQNTPADAVILEHPGKSYSYYSRVSALSGRPTLVGWDFHEYQWRGSNEETGKRLPDIDVLYNGISPETTLTLLDKYDINYVYVGSLERETYSQAGLAKFNTLLDVAFTRGDVVIYKR